MEKELQNQLTTILEKLSSSVEKGGTFVLEQLPDIVEQWMVFHMVVDICVLLGFVVGCFLWYKLSFKWTPQERTDYGSLSTAKEMSLVLGGITLVCFLIGAVIAFVDFLQIIFAPKVWIIQNIVSLIK